MTQEEYQMICEKYQAKFVNQYFLLEVQVTGHDYDNIYSIVSAKTGWELYKEIEAAKEWHECPNVYAIARFVGDNHNFDRILAAIRREVHLTDFHPSFELIEKLGGEWAI